jgi:hypothetical protein
MKIYLLHSYTGAAPYLSAVIIQISLAFARYFFSEQTKSFFREEQLRQHVPQSGENFVIGPGVSYQELLPANYRSERLAARFARDGDAAQALVVISGLAAGAVLRPEFINVRYQALVLCAALLYGFYCTYQIARTPIERYAGLKVWIFGYFTRRVLFINALCGLIIFTASIRLRFN